MEKAYARQVRGTAQNPVDHPHGGGEGRQGGAEGALFPYGGQTDRQRTKISSHQKYSNKFIVSRRKVGKQR